MTNIPTSAVDVARRQTAIRIANHPHPIFQHLPAGTNNTVALLRWMEANHPLTDLQNAMYLTAGQPVINLAGRDLDAAAYQIADLHKAATT